MKSSNFVSIASYTGMPCITISMNTRPSVDQPDHRLTELARLAGQARFLAEEKSNTPVHKGLLDKLESLPVEVSKDKEAESISIFLSDTVDQVLYSPWPVPQNRVQVADRFDLRPLIEISNNYCEYDLLILHHKAIRLLRVKNDKVTGEIKDDFFPIMTDIECIHQKGPDAIRQQHELFDRLDSELIKRFNKTKMQYVIAAPQSVYAVYMTKARFHSLYPAHISPAGDLSHHKLALAAWSELLQIKDNQRRLMIGMVCRLAEEGKALKDPHEILATAREGRGDILVVDWGARLTEDEETMLCEIIWHVVRHKGKVIMAEKAELDSLGSITLKVCY